MLDFETPGAILALQERVKAEVDAECAKDRKTRFSVRISPSTLGDECVAAVWFAWRWVKMPKPTNGRMTRYLARGDVEEANVIARLRRAGWTIREKDDKGRQYAVSGIHGHLYGKMDGLASHPVHTGGVEVLFENKFVNYKRFATLISQTKPMSVIDPKYYGQICLYMYLNNLPAAMFVVGNRNDDDIEYRFFPRNDEVALELLQTGEAVALSPVRPARIAESPTFWKCKGCDFVDICHNGEPVALNCRSCFHCVPVEGGNFFCRLWNQGNIPKDVIAKGCPQHKPIV